MTLSSSRHSGLGVAIAAAAMTSLGRFGASAGVGHPDPARAGRAGPVTRVVPVPAGSGPFRVTSPGPRVIASRRALASPGNGSSGPLSAETYRPESATSGAQSPCEGGGPADSRGAMRAAD